MMRKRVLAAGISGFLLVVSGIPMLSHHGTGGNYDLSKKITLKGVVTRVEWINPHSFVYIDVTADNGKVESWAVEGNPPTALNRQGWTEGSLKPGTVIIVSGILPLNTARLAGKLSYSPLAVSRLNADRLMQANEIALETGEKRVFGMAPAP